VPVDQTNLRTHYPGVYATCDVCTGPRTVPEAGIFAESAARVVADDIAATISGGEPPAPYGGSGICYAEFGDGLVSKVEVNFLSGETPAAQTYHATLEYAADKDEFGPLGGRAGSAADHEAAVRLRPQAGRNCRPTEPTVPFHAIRQSDEGRAGHPERCC
jgi:hypothetical protein